MKEVTDSEIQQHALYLCKVYQQMKDETIRKMPSNIKPDDRVLSQVMPKVNVVFSNGVYYVSRDIWLGMIFGTADDFGITIIDNFIWYDSLQQAIYYEWYSETPIPEYMKRHAVMVESWHNIKHQLT